MSLVSLVGCGDSADALKPNETTIVSINIVPKKIATRGTPNLSLAIGNTQDFSAFATYSDGQTADVTASANWSINTISNTDEVVGGVQAGALTGISEGYIEVFADYENIVSNIVGVEITNAKISELSIISSQNEIPLGMIETLKAIATYSDNSSYDVTRLVDWHTDDEDDQVVDGVLKAKRLGDVVVFANIDEFEAQKYIKVNQASVTGLVIKPLHLHLAKGTSETLQVTGFFSDGSQHDVTRMVSWESSSQEKVKVYGDGVLIGLAVADDVEVTARYGGESVSVPVTVTDATLDTLTISYEGRDTLPTGLSTPIKAEGRFSDGTVQNLTSQVTWVSNQPQVATVVEGVGQKQLQAVSPG
ncbi:Ig-like domain-containing protein, partial [Vibrio coralliilyticus]|uniref:Ig-like domain-containing protein n=1 Tax=Vibrio coralliilyticus TaxID=190893 RepID=UPI0015614410